MVYLESDPDFVSSVDCRRQHAASVTGPWGTGDRNSRFNRIYRIGKTGRQPGTNNVRLSARGEKIRREQPFQLRMHTPALSCFPDK